MLIAKDYDYNGTRQYTGVQFKFSKKDVLRVIEESLKTGTDLRAGGVDTCIEVPLSEHNSVYIDTEIDHVRFIGLGYFSIFGSDYEILDILRYARYYLAEFLKTNK